MNPVWSPKNIVRNHTKFQECIVASSDTCQQHGQACCLGISTTCPFSFKSRWVQFFFRPTRPPSLDRPSRIVTWTPSETKISAHLSPARPAPTMPTCGRSTTCPADRIALTLVAFVCSHDDQKSFEQSKRSSCIRDGRPWTLLTPLE